MRVSLNWVKKYVDLPKEITNKQLSYDLSTKLDDINCEALKAGHLIDKECIKPVFLRMDSELADKKK